MTKEEKQLLLIDLCARLPYGVIIQITSWGGMVGASYDMRLDAELLTDLLHSEEDDFKPYLRPMSSMTEDEIDYVERHFYYTGYNDWDFVDWLNKNHFDYRGLIPMGLALETPEGMYDK